MSYKKRAKVGWERNKQKSNRSERQYEKKEIRQALEEEFQGDDYRYNFQSKKRFDSPIDRKIYKLDKAARWYERAVERWERRPANEYIQSVTNSWKDRVKKIREKIKILLDKKKKM